MKPIPVLGIPHYNRPELTERCIASIDYPVDKLVIVLNAPTKTDVITAWRKAKPACVKSLEFASHPNAGVAGAWNEIIKLWPAEWWLIVNNDIAFTAGDLAKMAIAVQGDSGSYVRLKAALFYGNHGSSWFALTSACVNIVGLFDEGFFPAYDEDCDFGRRCDLLDVPRINVQGTYAIHGDATRSGSCTVNATPELAAENSRTHGSNNEYYKAKWGGLPGQETFTTPFNDPGFPVWAWTFSPTFRKGQQWKAGV